MRRRVRRAFWYFFCFFNFRVFATDTELDLTYSSGWLKGMESRDSKEACQVSVTVGQWVPRSATVDQWLLRHGTPCKLTM